jgi:hypothetical protein
MNEDLTIYFSQAEDSLQAARTLKSNGLCKGAVRTTVIMRIFGLFEVYF